MKPPHRAVLSLLAAAAMLPACGGSQNAATTMPPSVVAQDKAHGASGSSGDLIYALARGPRNLGSVYVLTYPDGNYVSQFYTPIKAGLPGICSDAKGNVFITQWDGRQGYIYEYSHGSTVPSATLKVNQPDIPVGCDINHANGDLAVSFGSGRPGVAIFHNASGTPKYYTFKGFSGAGQATFDGNGNFFAIFATASAVKVFELPSGSKRLTPLEFDTYMNPYDLQWDGKYLAIAIFDQHAQWLVYRVSASNFQGYIVSTITFEGLRRNAGSFWIQGDNVIVPASRRSKSGKMAIYRYPQGGSPDSMISGYKVKDLTVSIASSR